MPSKFKDIRAIPHEFDTVIKYKKKKIEYYILSSLNLNKMVFDCFDNENKF